MASSKVNVNVNRSGLQAPVATPRRGDITGNVLYLVEHGFHARTISEKTGVPVWKIYNICSAFE
jgi:hypothetical protein